MNDTEKKALHAKLSDPMWRLTSGELYKIQTADGQGLVPFKPRPEQVAIFRAILEDGVTRLMIPKARRLGMSTAIGVLAVDMGLFRGGTQASLVDQNASDASKKLDMIMRVALDNLPLWLKAEILTDKDNDARLKFAMGDKAPANIYAGMNARGGSNDLLWVSEWGVIQFEDPKRSAKIKAGALPSARFGVVIIETTWAGGKTGDVWDLLRPTIEDGVDDWTVLFSPWWVDPRNVNDSAVIDDAAKLYFQSIAKRAAADGIKFTIEQIRWWARERREQGIFMRRENPTFLDECWSAPIEGSIYASHINQAEIEGRISEFPVTGAATVHTAWDLGAPYNTVVWYFQVVGREILIIDCDMFDDWALGGKTDIVARVAYMKSKGYSFGQHLLPHDAQQTERSGKTMMSALKSAGLTGCVCVPACSSLWPGINHAIEMFPTLSFRLPACRQGLDALACYRKRPIKEGGKTDDKPVHDQHSHAADALRTLAEGHLTGLIKLAGVRLPEGSKRKRQGMRRARVGRS